MIFKADVSDSAAVNDMIKAVSEKYESIDVVVNNSGITKDNLILRMSEEDFLEKVIDINLKGCFNVSKAVLKPMLKQKERFYHKYGKCYRRDWKYRPGKLRSK